MNSNCDTATMEAHVLWPRCPLCGGHLAHKPSMVVSVDCGAGPVESSANWKCTRCGALVTAGKDSR